MSRGRRRTFGPASRPQLGGLPAAPVLQADPAEIAAAVDDLGERMRSRIAQILDEILDAFEPQVMLHPDGSMRTDAPAIIERELAMGAICGRWDAVRGRLCATITACKDIIAMYDERLAPPQPERGHFLRLRRKAPPAVGPDDGARLFRDNAKEALEAYIEMTLRLQPTAEECERLLWTSRELTGRQIGYEIVDVMEARSPVFAREFLAQIAERQGEPQAAAGIRAAPIAVVQERGRWARRQLVDGRIWDFVRDPQLTMEEPPATPPPSPVRSSLSVQRPRRAAQP